MPGRGPFLFGPFTITDAMFAPVCSRFATYAVPLPAAAQAYVEQMMELPAMLEWGRLAHAELTGGEPMPASLPPEPDPSPPIREPVIPPVTVVSVPTPAKTILEPEPEPSPEPSPPPVQAAPVAVVMAPPPPVPLPTAPGEPPAELRRAPRPIPSTIMVKPIGDGTRRRR